jgi:hypothetical protein
MNSKINYNQPSENGQREGPFFRLQQPETSLNDLLPDEPQEGQRNRRSSSVMREEIKSRSSQSSYLISSKQYDTLKEELECKICFSVLVMPVYLTCCHHIFCRDCISMWEFKEKKLGKPAFCPLCKAEFTRHMFNSAHTLQILADIQREIKQSNNLFTQIPPFKPYDPIAILNNSRKQKEMKEEEKKKQEEAKLEPREDS